MDLYILLGFALILAIFVGFEVISKVPAILHTPLMSETNALSGITLIGALLAGTKEFNFASVLAMLAIVLATINIVGGYVVTDRMLKMFKKNEK